MRVRIEVSVDTRGYPPSWCIIFYLCISKINLEDNGWIGRLMAYEGFKEGSLDYIKEIGVIEIDKLTPESVEKVKRKAQEEIERLKKQKELLKEKLQLAKELLKEV